MCVLAGFHANIPGLGIVVLIRRTREKKEKAMDPLLLLPCEVIVLTSFSRMYIDIMRKFKSKHGRSAY